VQEISERYRHVRDSAIVMQQALLAPSVPVVSSADHSREVPGGRVEKYHRGRRRLVRRGGSRRSAGAHRRRRSSAMGRRSCRGDVTVAHRPADAISAGRSVVEALEAVDHFSKNRCPDRSRPLCVSAPSTLTPVNSSTATAGHPPPLLITSDATAQYLSPSGAGPLGSGRGFAVPPEMLEVGRRDPAVQRWPDRTTGQRTGGQYRRIRRPGSKYRRRTRLSDGRLGAPHRPHLFADTRIACCGPPGYNDDVTLLAARQRTAPQSLRCT